MNALVERPPLAPERRRRLIATLRGLLPADALLSADEALRPYECDGLSAYRSRPLAVALPHSIAETQAVLRACHAAGIPVVARGSGTGLSGGAYPLSDGVLLSLARMKSILSIDLENRSARVQPGVRNLAISEAVAPYGLYYAPDPSSQIACSIGGNVAENSGGVHCLKYGLTTHNLLKLEVLLADGERVTIGADALDAAGYDLLALMTGSEGLLGVVVEVTVKLLPKPESARVVMAAFDSVEACGAAVGDVIGAGIIPAGMEMMDKPAMGAAEDFLHCGYPVGSEAMVLVELDGLPEEVEDGIRRVEAVMRARGATDVRVSRNEAERANFWAGRKNAFPAVGRISPDYYCIDGTIPRGQLPHVLGRMRELSTHYRQRIANVFHAGDGNLHPLILYDANQPGEMERTEALALDILKLCVDVGGTITGEHGVGIEKINAMCHQFTSAEIEQFHAVKHAFDPAETLNPGKAIPTLHRCAEFGALHVHHGQLPHPELPRF
ncbi:MAG: FAD-binding protein [Nevskiaceae bacterium]|nr:MAG: FAD-binding protein [Nevskiaceae bacterium]TBR71632.1 MAG: FAD-binding protein [Nevskiaceae bacterium]